MSSIVPPAWRSTQSPSMSVIAIAKQLGCTGAALAERFFAGVLATPGPMTYL